MNIFRKNTLTISLLLMSSIFYCFKLNMNSKCNTNSGTIISTDSIMIDSIFKSLEYLSLPISYSNNVESSSNLRALHPNEIIFLQLNDEKIIPNFNMETSLISLENKINLSNNFYSIIARSIPNENEIHSILLNFTKNLELIEAKLIAYDEVAESCFKIEAIIDYQNIHIYHFDNCYQNKLDTLSYSINCEGKFEPK